MQTQTNTSSSDNSINLRTAPGREAFKKAVAKFFRGKTPVTCADIAESLDATTLQVRTALNALIEDGVIVATGNTRARTYSKAPSAND